MKGASKYSKLTKEWESYTDSLFKSFVKEFPTTKGMTQKAVAKFLVDNDWIEKIQSYTYRSYLAGGSGNITFDEYKDALMTFKTYEGKIINAWDNSYERAVARRMVKRMKKGAKVMNERLAHLDKTENPDYLRTLSDRMVYKPKGLDKRIKKLDAGGYTSLQREKEMSSIKSIIKDDMVNAQYKRYTEETVSKVNTHQGKIISQDQLQYSNNKAQEEIIEEAEYMMRGEWKLSPHHHKHYYKGGVDPCEKFAAIRYFFDDDIPQPVKDTHFKCSCSVTLKRIIKV